MMVPSLWIKRVPANDRSHAAARTLRLLRHRRSSAAEIAWRRAHDCLDHRQSRSLGYFQADGPPGVAAADRCTLAAGRAELELARIWNAGRRVAVLRSLQKTRHRADALDQRARLRGLSARGATGQGRRLGIHGSCL